MASHSNQVESWIHQSRLISCLDRTEVRHDISQLARVCLEETATAPLLGWLVDAACIITGMGQREPNDFPTSDPRHLGLCLQYRDYVIGRMQLDQRLNLASELIATELRDQQAAAMGFVLWRIMANLGLPGTEISLTALRRAEQRYQRQDITNAKVWEQLKSTCQAFLHGGELLTEFDLELLRSGVASGPRHQRESFATITELAARIHEQVTPPPKRRATLRQPEQATKLRTEDTYPVGGFAAISRRGTFESLLQSQLAFCEEERPDLFDVRYLRNELLFYGRDDNEIVRPRMAVTITLDASLAVQFVKPPHRSYPPIFDSLAGIVTLVRTLLHFGESAIRQIYLHTPADWQHEFQEEIELMRLLLRREQLQRRVIMIDSSQDAGQRDQLPTSDAAISVTTNQPVANQLAVTPAVELAAVRYRVTLADDTVTGIDRAGQGTDWQSETTDATDWHAAISYLTGAVLT